MANTAASFGFRHIGYISGGAVDYQLATGTILSTNATKIFRGDPITIDPTTGFITQAADNVSTVQGVFDGCMYTPVGGTPAWSPFWPGAAGGPAVAYFINAPSSLFIAAAFNTSLVTANIGENVGFKIGTGQTTGGGFSGATIDQSSLNTTNTLPFRVVAPCTTSGNFGIVGNGSDPSTAFGWAVVAFNNTNFKQLTGLA